MSEPKPGRSVALSPGDRLGPYEILSLLGAGGMGQVYRARDVRLAREVALKILPQAIDEDAGRFRRFQTEAKAAAALSHPGIVAVHDIGLDNGTAYIVSELVPGGTLTTLLERGPLAVKKLLDLAIPIADALAAAHANGVVHRDLKPDNILIAADGTPKIADFGLAKYLLPTPPEGSIGTTLPDDRTREGMIVGTVGYMSPEQAQGKPVDFRSDQFSFGSVLYEMATSTRAFRRKTVIDTLAAIINEDPEPIATTNPGIPAPLRWIVERCHAKDAEGRYASTQDLARELTTIREHLPEATSKVSLKSSPPARHRAIGLALVSALLVASGILLSRLLWLPPSPSNPSFRQLTFRRGNILRARYAPEGGSIVYGAAWEGAPPEIFTARVDGTESRPFGIVGADVLAVSPRGDVAIQLRKTNVRSPNGVGTLAVVPLAGGAPRELLEDVISADWNPAGTELAVVRSESGTWRIEYPIGHVLYTTTRTIDPAMRVSRNGDRIAFIEDTRVSEFLNVIDRSGTVTTLLKSEINEVINGLVWGSNDREIIFGRFVGNAQGNVSSIDTVDLNRRVRQLYRGAVLISVNDSIAGRLLVEQAKESTELMFGSSKEPVEKNLSWQTSSWPDNLSEDGRMVLFHDHTDYYLRRTDGSPAVRLGPGAAGSLSPDGRFVLLTTESQRGISMIPIGPGRIETIATGDLNADYPELLGDGRSIVFGATAGDGQKRLWVMDTDGTKPRSISEPVSKLNWAISPDGTKIALGGATGLKIYGLEGKPPREVPGFDPQDTIFAWTADGQALYVGAIDVPTQVARFDLFSGRKTPWKTLRPADLTGVYMIGPVCVTRDGSSWAYGASRSSTDELWQLTGLPLR